MLVAHANPVPAVPAGDLRERLRLLLRARLRAVELDEEHRHLGEVGLRVAVAGPHLDLVEQLDPRHRDAELDRLDHRVDGSLDRLERAGRGRDHLRDAEEPERHLGDHAERALAADEEPRQVVARSRLPRPSACPDHAAVGEDDRQAEDVLAHRPVAHRGRPGRARRGHAADRRVRAWVDGEEEALGRKALREGEPRQPGFDAAVEIRAVDLEHLGHPGQIDADPAAQRTDMALERGPGPERDHGNPRGGAGADRVRHLLGRLREEDGIGRSRRVVRLVPPVQVENGLARGDARAVARAELLDDAGRPLMHRAPSLAA